MLNVVFKFTRKSISLNLGVGCGIDKLMVEANFFFAEINYTYVFSKKAICTTLKGVALYNS